MWVRAPASRAASCSIAVHRKGSDRSRPRRRRFLFGECPLPLGSARAEGWLLAGVTRNNLNGLDVAFPLACSRLSRGYPAPASRALVSQALVELVAEHLGHDIPAQEEGEELERAAVIPASGRIVGGMKGIKRLVRVDQKPIGRTPRSNLATYTGLFDHVRRLFAATKQARARHTMRDAFLQRRQGTLSPVRG